MSDSFKPRVPSLRQRNEYFENEDLIKQHEGTPPQEGFIRAVRGYEKAEGHVRQAYLIEAVIRTSRGLDDNHRRLPWDTRETLAKIMKQYELFSPTKLDTIPRTFAEARQVLRILFF